MLIIDGSHGEGGGQILRTGIALSAAFSQPVRIINIRAKRRKPGLASQHLHAIKAVAMLCGAEVRGARIGSKEIEFIPEKKEKKNKISVDIGTAGSIPLVIQAILPYACTSDREIEAEIKGGTDVEWSPSIDYVRFVLKKILEKMGIKFEVKLIKRGYYPKGSGKVIARFYSAEKIRGIKIPEKGKLIKISGISHAGNLPLSIAERQKTAAVEMIKKKTELLDNKIEITVEENKTFCAGTGITIFAEYEKTILGASSLGKIGKRAEFVGEEAANELLKEHFSKATLDKHMCDQIIPFAALAEGETAYISQLTKHAETNLSVVKKFIEIEEEIKNIGRGLMFIKILPKSL